MKLDHVGIAVHSIEDALRTYQQRLGFTVHEIVVIDEQKVRVAVLPAGDSRIELLEPTAPDSPIQKFLEKRGEGVHHLCFQVEDIRQKDRGTAVCVAAADFDVFGDRIGRAQDRISASQVNAWGID